MNKIECKICGSKKISKHIKTKDFFLSQEEFVMNKCLNCDFIFTHLPPNKKEIYKYYESEDYLSHNQTKTLISWCYNIIKKRNLLYKAKIIRKYSKSDNLLDFGCGTGDFIKIMQDKKYNIFGVENNYKAKKISEKITQNIFKEIKEINPKNKKFDLITFWHSLEHVHDLNSFFKECLEKLNEKGTIVIALPNNLSHDAKYYKKHWAAYDVPRHLHHFNKKSMSFFVKNFNLKITKILPLKYDSYFISLMSEKYKKSNLKMFRAFIRGFLSNLKSNGENHSSLIYIIKK
tara:strand:- start:207 stop:1073 length:867 start_codon:yes stop_codon:yes gene_type:complete